MRKNRHFLTLILLAAGLLAQAKSPAGVAIIIDSESYAAEEGAVAKAVDNYAGAIRQYDGKNTFLIVADTSWTPDIIRERLIDLRENKNLEGAVLVGNIPIPMIRRAHHLSTAFKMNPSMPIERSSIPSDRFYDDFGLEFKYLERRGPLFFYDLSPEGDQRVKSDIYTARIKPSKADPDHSFTYLIAEFLDKAAEAKKSPEKLDRLFHFGGHGNSSESFNARIDEDRAMHAQFGIVNPEGRVSYLNFDEDTFVRMRLLSALQDPALDYAHIHSHGGVGAQYISKEPYTFMTSGHLDMAKLFFRTRMRNAKDHEKAKASIIATYGVPESFMDGWDDPVMAAKDSAFRASTDISLEDLDNYVSGVRVLLLDACFNGAFLHDDYVAARYAFSHGSRTLAVTANSVNIIQDHWKNELAGLMQYGVCVGNWAKMGFTLESHLFGDPTTSFEVGDGSPKGLDRIVAEGLDRRTAEKFLRSNEPELAAYAIHEGFLPKGGSLEEILLSAADPNLRMEAMMRIIRSESDTRKMVEALRTGLNDPYELIRRMASSYADRCGDPSLLPDIARHYLDPFETTRVRYHLLAALSLYPYQDVEAELKKAWNGSWPLQGDFNTQLSRLKSGRESDVKEFASISDSSVSAKERGSVVSAQRNRCNPGAVEPMVALIADETAPADLRCKAAEALGWYVYSFRRQAVYDALKALSVENAAVGDEVKRSLRRLEDNAFTN